MYICENNDIVISTLHSRKNAYELHYIKNNNDPITKQFDNYNVTITKQFDN